MTDSAPGAPRSDHSMDKHLPEERHHEERSIPEWKLPLGVTRGTWDYFHHRMMAADYDAYHAYNRLFEFDEQILWTALGRI